MKTLKEIVTQLKDCGYECEAGPLANNEDFRLLAKLAGVEVPKTLAERISEATETFVAMGRSIKFVDKGVLFISQKSPQERRDEIVERAKRDLDDHINKYGEMSITIGGYDNQCITPKFFVNREKRAVTVLLFGAFSKRLYAKGIAKCAPDDCFNVHIGKAIALRRALGLIVPAEYLNAPQPTEACVGDVIRHYRVREGWVPFTLTSSNREVGKGGFAHINSRAAKDCIIIDDSREEVTE